MQCEVISCAGWSDFKYKVPQRLFGAEPFRRATYWFRGQRDSRWVLKASYDRWFDELKLEERLRISMAESLLLEFERHAEESVPTIEQRRQMLALAQHYGLPTRLLDWTESPYTAAFFAFSEALEKYSDGSNVAVFALDSRSYVWKGRGVTLVEVKAGPNARLRNQDGRFTLLESTATCLEDHIEGLPSEDPWPLYRFEIPASEARHALSELDIMGVNAHRLYPDLQGYSLNAKLAVLSRSADR
jgi:FRG domain